MVCFHKIKALFEHKTFKKGKIWCVSHHQAEGMTEGVKNQLLKAEIGVNSTFLNSTSDSSACKAI